MSRLINIYYSNLTCTMYIHLIHNILDTQTLSSQPHSHMMEYKIYSNSFSFNFMRLQVFKRGKQHSCTFSFRSLWIYIFSEWFDNNAVAVWLSSGKYTIITYVRMNAFINYYNCTGISIKCSGRLIAMIIFTMQFQL